MMNIYKRYKEFSKRKNLLPIYLIIWRMIWWLPMVSSIALAAIAVGIFYGYEDGLEFWKSNS